METKGIDLTKCRNERARIRYRYGFDESSVYDATGYIEQVKDGRVHLVNDEDEGFIPLWHDGKIDENIMTFEIVPRDPETYKDWQVGDKVCEDEHRNACYEVIFRSGELVVFKDWNNWASNPMTISEAFTRFGMRLVLTDIEQQIIRKKKYEPQDGDICFVEASDGYCSIFIYKNGFHRTNYYASLDTDKGCSTILLTGGGHVVANSKITVLRPATEEERQKLFDAMAKGGKRWNAEKKVVEDIPKPYEFKKGEPVLVRNFINEPWELSAFIEKDDKRVKAGYPFGSGPKYRFNICLPYNKKTMYLLGTTEDYKEE